MHIPRRTFLASFAAMVFPRFLFAANRRLDIRIDPTDFGKARVEDIRAVLLSAAEEIWKHCPSTQFDTPGFHIFHRKDSPITIFDRTKDNRIAIGLATLDAVAWAAGFDRVTARLGDLNPIWFLVAFGAQALAYVGYVFAYREIARV